MCKPNDGHFHEDFEDEPSVEERFPDDDLRDESWRDEEDDFDDEEFDAELAQDIILERQELEDFEGLSGPFEDRDEGVV